MRLHVLLIRETHILEEGAAASLMVEENALLELKWS
jgi:hypothetical protein